MQHYCRNCNAPLEPGSAVCASCGMPLHDVQPIEATIPAAPSSPPAQATADQAPPPTHQRTTPLPARSSRKRGLLYTLLGTLLLLLCFIIGALVSVISSSFNAAQQPPTTGAHITSIQTGLGFDTTKALVTGPTRSFKVGQAVFIVFTVNNQDPNAQIVVKLFRDSALESTSNPLTPEIGTNTYAIPIVLHSAGAHSCQIVYNNTTEASISFNVTS